MASNATIGDMTPEQPKQENGQVAKDDQPRRGAVIFSRPKDDTFEAYKAWILSMTRALTGQDNDDMTEDQWREEWREFWAGRPAE